MSCRTVATLLVGLPSRFFFWGTLSGSGESFSVWTGGAGLFAGDIVVVVVVVTTGEGG